MRKKRAGNLIAFVVLALSLVALGACSQVEHSDIDYNTIEWVDLMPQEDLDALLNPPDFLSTIVDGSAEDQIDNQMQTTLSDEPQTAYQKALVSSNVVGEYNDQNIRLPGFIVPLEFDEEFVVTEFFLVPYFGACLHTPPPPPNQIVFVKHEAGLTLESIEQPYWVSGLLTTDSEVNDMAHAAYTLAANEVTLYEVQYED